jgi:hypothetical protein
MKHVTNRKIFKAIYKKHYKTFKSENTKYDVEVDMKAISDDLGMDMGTLWGRLYFDVNERNGFKDNRKLFYPQSRDTALVHFPLLSALIAIEEEEYRRNTLLPTASLTISVVSLIAAFVSVSMSLLEFLK